MKQLHIFMRYWIGILFFFLFNLFIPYLIFGQSIEFNHQVFVEQRSTILRNIKIDGDSLIISGELGSNSSGIQGVFVLCSDTTGNLGRVEIFEDPQQIDHLLLNGSNSIIYNNEEFVFAGDILCKSDNYLINYNRTTGEYFYKLFSAPFIVRFTETLLAFGGTNYIVGYVQTQNFDLDVFLQKIDSSGNKIWEKTYGLPSKDETGRAAIIEDDGLTIMISESFDNTPTIKNDTKYWIRFMHVDTSGAIVRDWREEVTGHEGWSGTLLKYRDDYIYTCNTIGDEIGIGPLTGGQIVRRDSSFNLVWRKKLGDPDSPFTGLGDMIFSADSCLLVTVAPERYNHDRLVWVHEDMDTYGADVMIAGEYASVGDFESALDVLETNSSSGCMLCMGSYVFPPVKINMRYPWKSLTCRVEFTTCC